MVHYKLESLQVSHSLVFTCVKESTNKLDVLKADSKSTAWEATKRQLMPSMLMAAGRALDEHTQQRKQAGIKIFVYIILKI